MAQSWPDTAKYRPNTSPIHLTGRKTSQKSSLRRKFSRLRRDFCLRRPAHLLHRYSTVPTLCCNTTLLEVLTRCNTCFWSCYNTRCNTSPQEVLPTLFTPVLGLDAPLAPTAHTCVICRGSCLQQCRDWSWTQVLACCTLKCGVRV